MAEWFRDPWRAPRFDVVEASAAMLRLAVARAIPSLGEHLLDLLITAGRARSPEALAVAITEAWALLAAASRRELADDAALN